MGENVQCPVCTLFLRAGMSLSDHLETHPKEQVIKALVQLTISGGGAGADGGALAAALSLSSCSQKVEAVDLKPTTSKKQPAEKNNSSENTIKFSDGSRLQRGDATSGLLAKALTTQKQQQQQQQQPPPPPPNLPENLANNGNNPLPNNLAWNQAKPVTTISQSYQSNIKSATDPSNNNNNNNSFRVVSSSSSRVQTQIRTHPSYQGVHQSEKRINQAILAQSLQSQQPQQTFKNITTAYPIFQPQQQHQQHGPSQPSHHPIALRQQPQQLQQSQSTPVRLVASTSATVTGLSNSADIPTISRNQINEHQNTLYPTNGQQHRVQQIISNEAHQQDLKIIFSNSNLPPPPPLQVLSYQTQQQQHQKPPPAYGAAISQMRSQSNQIKQNNYASSQQQQPQHQAHSSLTAVTNQHCFTLLNNTPTTSKNAMLQASIQSNLQSFNQTSNIQQQQQQQQLHQHQQHQQQHMPRRLQCTNLTTNNTTIKAQPHNNLGLSTNTQYLKAIAATPLLSNQASISTLSSMISSSTTATLTNAASISNVRANNSTSFASLLATASPSSVLRYAESPVAHYLERENGDFIVQETPKHIVECVEKDNGEFSVIERIYQSPPSVLHIHDDNEEETDDVGSEETMQESDECSKDNVKDPEDGEENTVTKIEAKEEEFIAEEPKNYNALANSINNSTVTTTNTTTTTTTTTIATATTWKKDHRFQKSIPTRDNEEQSGSRSNNNISKNNTRDNQNECSTSSAAPLCNSDSNSNSISNSNSNSNSNNNSFAGSSKKTSKNSITVLSDVQLNLSEYLDLVGTIIASSKISNAQGNNVKISSTAGAVPIPLVKVEKVEPIDEYDDSSTAPSTSKNSSNNSKLEQINNKEHVTIANKRLSAHNNQQRNGKLDSITTEQPINAFEANKNETESSSSVSNNNINDNDNTNKNTNITLNKAIDAVDHCQGVNNNLMITQSKSLQQQQQQQQTNENSNNVKKANKKDVDIISYPHHVSSGVIRMASTVVALAAPTPTSSSLEHQNKKVNNNNNIKRLHDELPTTSKDIYKRQALAAANSAGVQEEQEDEEEDIAEDLSKPQKSKDLQDLKETVSIQYPITKIENISENTVRPSLFLKKPPKKLVIKPKSSTPIVEAITTPPPPTSTITVQLAKTDRDAKCNLTTANSLDKGSKGAVSSSAATSTANKNEKPYIQENIIIKVEPSNSSEASIDATKESNDDEECGDEEFVEEKPKITETHLSASIKAESKKTDEASASSSTSLMQADQSNTSSIATVNENSVTDDARVLFDFANSTKQYAASKLAEVNVAGPSGLFSSTSIFSTMHHAAASTSAAAKISKSFSADSLPHSLRCEDEFIGIDESDVQEIISSSYNQKTKTEDKRSGDLHKTQEELNDYPFSFLYNNSENASFHRDIKEQSIDQLSTLHHHQTTDGTTTNATVASSSTMDTIDDSSASKPISSEPTESSRFDKNISHMWYQQATLVAHHQDFDHALGAECNAGNPNDDNANGGKYLDLDACKRENTVCDLRIAPSTTSSSFTTITDSNLVGEGGSGSTADALNVRTDEKMPAKGEISEQESNCDIENSWSQPPYSDVPARFFKTTFPGMFPHDNGAGTWHQEEYFAIHDLSTAGSSAVAATNEANFLEQKPQTKCFDLRLVSEAGNEPINNFFSNNALHIFPQQSEAMPSTSASVTASAKKKRKRDSLSIAEGPLNSTLTSQQPSLMNFIAPHIGGPKPSTSTALDATATSSSSAVFVDRTASQTRVRRKIYQCPHCNMKFAKLRDRNAHMIIVHNYVRQNRRLICSQPPPSATITSAELQQQGGDSDINTMSEDSKANIVKIKTECEQQALQGNLHLSGEGALVGQSDGLASKLEYTDDKGEFSLLQANLNQKYNDNDTKPNLQQPLTIATPATKLVALYRMLISFNISTLKQNRALSDWEEKLIETSVFFCYTCRSKFPSVKLYDAHLTEHPADCFTCGKKFHRWKNFSLHLKRHLGWKEFGCNVCDKKFVVRSALVEHMRMHTGHTPLKCKICGKSFKRYSNLTQHRKRHGRVLVRRKEYVCHCGEVLPSKARFLWHKEIHDSKPKCCPHCCDRFVHANSLRRHIRLAHSDKFDYTKPMECPMCKQIFAKSSIKAHMATHSIASMHDCPICNKSFTTKWNLKIHSWVHANRTAKPFKCEHCPKAFIREVDFKNHMNAHKQIKPYTCEYCGCKFIRKYNYMRHRREHHGNKKFTCDLCKKSFHRHYYLIEHRRIHTGERPFQCTICGKSSTTKANHNKHLKIHHSRDPFTVET